MNRLILAVCLPIWFIFGAACCFFGDAQQPPPERTEHQPAPRSEERPVPTKSGEPYSVTAGEVEMLKAEELYENYLNSKAATDAKYTGKVVEFSGVAHSSGSNVLDGPFIVCTQGPKGFVASAWFDKSLEKEVEAIKKGMIVHVRGKATKSVVMKRDGEVIFTMEECTIISVKGSDDPEQTPMKPPPQSSEDPTIGRKAAYLRISAAIAKVESEVGKKHELGTITYKVVLQRDTDAALGKLATELSLSRAELDSIQREGDSKGWPKK